MSRVSKLSLKELCENTGVTRRAVQGYEYYGLIRASGRSERGYLLYDEAAVEKVKQIRFYNEIGFRIKDIPEFLALSEEEQKEQLCEKRRKLRGKGEKIQNLLVKLDEMLEE